MTGDEVELGNAAAAVLRANDRGRMTVAAPRLYPHQWSWDAAFVAIGLAHLSVPRAAVELEHLLEGQWSTGMIPHIVFADDPSTDYFPGPDRWGCSALTDAAPRHPQTSGITQPPAHAIALARILDIAARQGATERDEATAFGRRVWPALYAWHRWLVERRRSVQSGLVVVLHGWESGMDNSPRFDVPYSRVVVGELPPYERTDLREADASERPTAAEYDRYLWLVEELRAVRYDDLAAVTHGSFRVGDVFMTAVLAVACDALAEVGERVGAGSNAARVWLADRAAELRSAVAASLDPATGLAADVDERAGERLAPETIAGFAPLLCGGLAAGDEARMLATLGGRDWAGHPGLVVRLPPSTTPSSPRFDPRRYWRGPMWPVIAWLFGWALSRRGLDAEAETFRREGLRLVADGRFGEYYQPFTGEPLGSTEQSWTAAVALDWLAADA